MIPNVFPVPRKWSDNGASFQSPSTVRIISKTDKFNSIVNSLKFANSIIGKPSILTHDIDNADYTIELDWSRDLAPQAYHLEFHPSGGQILSSSDAGMFYALLTFAQLYRNSGDTIKSQSIEDSPDLLDRGFMLDISRCKIPKLSTLFEFIDRLAQLKYNQLQLYMEHTFAYENHETVWKAATPYTAEDIKSIDRYCAERFIELVPNQNSFGHLERWLKHPEYRHLAECPDGYTHPVLGPLDHGGTLKPNEASIDFVTELHEELLPNFSSKRFNIGCDETWELGLGWSRSLAEKKGKRNVYLEHLIAITESVINQGIQPQFWGDIILEQPELVQKLPSQLCGLVWGYEADHPLEEQLSSFEKAGLEFIVAPGTSSWNTIGGRWTNAKANIESAISLSIKHGASGMLLTDWGDYGHHQPYVISLPPIVLAAGLSWCESNNYGIDALQTASRLFFDQNLQKDIARILQTLGEIYEKAGTPIHNASLLNKILFSKSNEMGELSTKLSENGLREASQILKTLKDDIQKLDSKDTYTRKSLARLHLATEMLLFSAKKGVRFLNNEIDLNWESDRLIPMTQIFRRLWLEDNREGGLEESSSRLLDTLA